MVTRQLVAANGNTVLDRLGHCDSVTGQDSSTLTVNTLAFQAQTLTAFFGIPIAGPNEVHDCDTLVLDSAGVQQGPLVGLWARQDLDSLDAQLPQGVALAAVTRLGPAYAPLGLTDSISCLFVRGDPRRNPDGTGWVATIQPLGRTGGCSPAQFPKTITLPLTVKRLTAAQLRVSSIPAVARWQAVAANVYHITIACGTGWCDIGPAASFAQPRLCTAPPGGDAKNLWFKKGGNGPLTWSDVCGVITPDQAVPTADEAYFATWKPAATIQLRPTNSPAGVEAVGYYQHKYRFDPNGGVVTLYLMYDSTSNVWHARFGTDPADEGHVTRFPFPHKHKGYARWKWHPNDQQVWVQCSQGCCQISGIS